MAPSLEPSSTGMSWTRASGTSTSSRQRRASTGRSSDLTGSTLTSSTGCSRGSSWTMPRSSTRSFRSGNASTISTALTEAWAAKLPTSAYASRPGPECQRSLSVEQLGGGNDAELLQHLHAVVETQFLDDQAVLEAKHGGSRETHRLARIWG